MRNKWRNFELQYAYSNKKKTLNNKIVFNLQKNVLADLCCVLFTNQN